MGTMRASDLVRGWEEWQLRVLVVASLAIQCILFVTGGSRKLPISSLSRRFIWLAYLGSDAVAIYALATLFNRHKEDGGGSSVQLEVLWAPILLIHLGGQDSITAYNMEDNELWTRRVFTVVSQMTVAIYVFSKSWPQGGDRRLLVAAILLFIHGIIKSMAKTVSLQNASINGIVSFAKPAGRIRNRQGKSRVRSLEDFVKRAASCTGEGSETLAMSNHYMLFADLAYPSDDRLRKKEVLFALDGDAVYSFLNKELMNLFDWLYTKRLVPTNVWAREGRNSTVRSYASFFFMAPFMCLPWAALVLFHLSHREDYNHDDVKVTYILLSFTALLISIPLNTKKVIVSTVRDILTRFIIPTRMLRPSKCKDDKVSQYNFLALCIRTKRYDRLMLFWSYYNLKDKVYQLWGMESSSSSRSITTLVYQHVKDWWSNIRDAPSYRMFNESRGQWTLGKEGCSKELGWIVEEAFDESVLLWHLATDFCYYYKDASNPDSVRSREMSNYMMYLLFMNPEMLIAGTRPNLVIVAREELNAIMENEIFPPHERTLAHMIFQKALRKSSANGSDEEGSRNSFILDALTIAGFLSGFPDDKMWRVIEGVWVEMLCFSAARSRGYLHAKGLATGAEYLTYVWLLWFYMGMETLAERLQRAHHHNEREQAAEPSSASDESRGTAQEQAAGPPTPQDSGATGDEQVAGPSTTKDPGHHIASPWSCKDSRASGEAIVLE